MANSVYPELNERARGWLRFLWQKATTPDDWSKTGRPNSWWDNLSNSPTLSFHRMDLLNSTYSVLMLADSTPAWREVYARIVDELADRHRTFFAAFDWLTQFGHDPERGRYSKEILDEFIPPHLQGQYDRPGWTANGIEPYGLQPDPIGADGMAFFRGFFNFILSSYRYVSDDNKWDKPFNVAGCNDQVFEWTHSRIADYASTQWSTRPAGPHCENTKIWPNCLSIAGLGLKLYDGVSGNAKHGVALEWLEYVKKHYMSVSKTGGLDWFCRYYDPVIDYIQKDSSTTALVVAFFLLPQNREYASFLYEAAMIENGWNDPTRPMGNYNPRFVSFGLLLARELGDAVTEARLRDYVERHYEPRFFGINNELFGWWFNLVEKYPRGQWSSVMMLAELGTGGSWSGIFEKPNLDKFNEPTLEGVDFATLNVSQAWNDKKSGVLFVRTACVPGVPERPTTLRITNLPDASKAIVRCDGVEFNDLSVASGSELLIRTSTVAHSFQIFTGYFGIGTTAKNRSGHKQAPVDRARLSRRLLVPQRPDRPRISSLSPGMLVHGHGCACCNVDVISS